MTNPIDYEARHLELAAQPGMEILRHDCPMCTGKLYPHCPTCDNGDATVGWLPLPEAERLGALIEVCHQRGYHVLLMPGFSLVSWHEGSIDPPFDQSGAEAPKPWAALTEALLAATEETK